MLTHPIKNHYKFKGPIGGICSLPNSVNSHRFGESRVPSGANTNYLQGANSFDVKVSSLSFLSPKEKLASKVLLSTPFSLLYAPLITINFVMIGKGIFGPTIFSSSFHAFFSMLCLFLMLHLLLKMTIVRSNSFSTIFNIFHWFHSHEH